MTTYGYLPVYPLALASYPERLTVRGLGREEVCKHPMGLPGFFNDFMTSPIYPWCQRWQYEGLVAKLPGYDYPMTKKFASMRDGWKEDYFSLPKYVDGLNAFIRDKLIMAARWMPSQCYAYGPQFELIQSGGHSLLHFHHQPERTTDGVPMPDRTTITFHTTYHTTRELGALGCEMMDNECGMSAHGEFHQAMKLTPVFWYEAASAFKVNEYTEAWNWAKNNADAVKRGTFHFPSYAPKLISYLTSNYDSKGTPLTEEEFNKIAFLGSEIDYLDELLGGFIFNKPFVGNLLTERIKVSLVPYKKKLSSYLCALEFTLHENFDEVLFVLTDELLHLLNWSTHWKQPNREMKYFFDGGQGTWQLSEGDHKGETLLTLRAKSKTERTVRVDMSNWPAPSYFEPPDLLLGEGEEAMGNAAVAMNMTNSNLRPRGVARGDPMPPIMKGIESTLPPTGLRLIRVADRSVREGQESITPQPRVRGLKRSAQSDQRDIVPSTNAGAVCSTEDPLGIPLCEGVKLSFLLNSLEEGGKHARKMYSLNDMVFRGVVKILRGDTGGSLTSNDRLRLKQRNLRFQALFFKSLTVTLVWPDAAGNTTDHVLYHCADEGARLNEHAIKEMFFTPAEHMSCGENKEGLVKRFSNYDFNESVSVEVAVPLFLFGEMPRHSFYTRGFIKVDLALGSPNEYLTALGSNRLPSLNLSITNAQIEVPTVTVDKASHDNALAPLLRNHFIDHVFPRFSFEHVNIELSEVKSSGGYTYTFTLTKPHDASVEAYIIAIVMPTPSNACTYDEHGLFSIRLAQVGEVIPADKAPGVRPTGWSYILGQECGTQKEGVIRAHEIYKHLQLRADGALGLQAFSLNGPSLFPFIPSDGYPAVGKPLTVSLQFPRPLTTTAKLIVLTARQASIHCEANGFVHIFN